MIFGYFLVTNGIHHGRQSVVDKAFFIPHSSWQLAREYLDDGMTEKEIHLERSKKSEGIVMINECNTVIEKQIMNPNYK